MPRYQPEKIIYILACLVITALYLYNLPLIPGFVADVQCWEQWGTYSKEHGLSHIYYSDTNYYPLYQYVLWIFAQLFNSPEALHEHMYLLRLGTFFFDIWGVYIVYRWLDKKYSFWLLLLISLINLSYCYNSLIWGQVDAILAALVFASLYSLWKRKYIVASVFLGLELAFKLQGIVFLPIFGLLLLQVTPVKEWWPKLGLSIAVFGATLLIVTLPFITSVADMVMIKKTIFGLVDYNNKLTVGAKNLWSIFYTDEANYIDDRTPLWANISYKQLGLLLFMFSSLLAFIPILYVLYRKLVKKEIELPLPLFILSTTLIALSFYFFNTQIHERYAHPLFLLCLLYAFLKRDFIPYIIFSVAYFFNLEGILQWAPFQSHRTFVFSNYFISGLYAILILYLFFRLYRMFFLLYRLRKSDPAPERFDT